ncbi:MAG: hypothetical protein Fur006_03270 [Coleofasciculaceae cyanobacterium]
MKILLLEDYKFMSAELAKTLKANHYTIALSADWTTQLERAFALEYDLIVLDLQIRNLDAIAFCRRLRSQGYHKPILLLTANNAKTDIVAGLNAGADVCVIKPYTPEEVLARIRALSRRTSETKRRKKYKPSAEDIATTNRVLARLSDSLKKRVAAQVTVLEQAHTALLADNLDEELKSAAQREAHKLAGSMATFGYPEGSKLGRAIEHLLMSDRILTPDEISRFCQLLAALQQELTNSPVTSTSSAVPPT